MHSSTHPPTHPITLHLLKIRLPTHNLGGINSLHLVDPAGRRHNLAHGAHLIARIPGDPDVVAALEDVLDVADIELRAVSELGQLARVADDVVDEVVGELEDGLGVVRIA